MNSQQYAANALCSNVNVDNAPGPGDIAPLYAIIRKLSPHT